MLPRAARAALVVALAAGSVGCRRAPRSPEEALARLRQAIEAGDGAAAFPLLDEPTRWSIESTYRYTQECLAIIEESYPAAAQTTEKARFLDAEDAPRFLAAYEARYHLLASLRPRLITLERAAFAHDAYGRWGYSGLRVEWDDIKQRASHDLHTVRENAKAYQRAAR